MKALTAADLYTLEDYARQRGEFRARVMAHKRNRRVDLGPNLALFFEDRLTMHYQVQEMLRAERIFEPGGIQEELDAYNPLIPDGGNWKATMMIQFDEIEERKRALGRLIGIEDRVWIKVGDHRPVTPVADEDLERDNEEKTSSVHFLRFELEPAMIADAKAGAPLAMGVDHPHYCYSVDPLPAEAAASLVADLD